MNIFEENKLFKRIENQPFTDIDGEIVMLNLENNEYYGLNKTASDVWRIIEKPTRFGDIINYLTKIYDVDKEKCAEEVTELIKKLLEKKLVIEVI